MIELVTDSDGRPAVRGDLDLTAVAALQAWLAQLDGPLIEIDLCGVTFFDSSALRTFLVARREHANLRIINPSSAVMKVLEITETLEHLTGDR